MVNIELLQMVMLFKYTEEICNVGQRLPRQGQYLDNMLPDTVPMSVCIHSNSSVLESQILSR